MKTLAAVVSPGFLIGMVARGRVRFGLGRLGARLTIVQPQVAKWTRACSYDRAGAGFSDAGPMARTSVRIADELHGALHNAGVIPVSA